MSFLNANNSEFLSVRITQKGRKAIAKGNFNIEYFQIGDSEFDYSLNLVFSGNTSQRVMSPFDKESGVKYPYKVDETVSGTTYGKVTHLEPISETIRNIMAPAGFVTENKSTGALIKTNSDLISFSSIPGGTSLTVADGDSFRGTDTVVLVFTGGTSSITGNSASLVYKIVSISGNTLEIDRPLPNLTGLTGNAVIIPIGGELEYSGSTCTPCPINESTHQLNPWTLDVVWGDNKPTGFGDETTTTGFTSNTFSSAKELLGYTSTGQTFTDFTGGTITSPTSYINSFGDIINVTPKEQRVIGIIHYSELGNLINDPDRFFKYDDYLSTYTGVTNGNVDEDDIPITDEEYFEIYIPYIYYHRNTGTTFGATFHMDSTDYYIKSTKNEKHALLFRYLLDEQNIKVGKVFPNNKIVVFDDQELVAILDLRSDRRHTLGAPKVSLMPHDPDPLFDGTTGTTLWVTYMLSLDFGYDQVAPISSIGSYPCNYYSKVESSISPSNISVIFTGDTFQYLNNTLTGITNGYIAHRFYILAQETTGDTLPTSYEWVIMDYTEEAGGNYIDNNFYLNSTGLTGVNFKITNTKYNNGVPFILEDFMGLGYTSPTSTQFGHEQKFPGSIKLVRASDIEPMQFDIPVLPFKETQNPTFVDGAEKRVTEVALLDSNKEVLVIGKLASPVKRTDQLIFSLKLDF